MIHSEMMRSFLESWNLPSPGTPRSVPTSSWQRWLASPQWILKCQSLVAMLVSPSCLYSPRTGLSRSHRFLKQQSCEEFLEVHEVWRAIGAARFFWRILFLLRSLQTSAWVFECFRESWGHSNIWFGGMKSATWYTSGTLETKSLLN